MANQDLNPSQGFQGSSYIYKQGTSANVRSAVSQKVRVLTPTYGDNISSQIGVVSSLSLNQSKTIDHVRGIGYGDMIAELVPGVTDPETATFERAMMNLANLWQATGYASGIDGPVRSLRHHKWPFDIEQQLVFSTLSDRDLGVENTGTGADTGSFGGGTAAISYPDVTADGSSQPGSKRGHSAVITMFETCWFNDWSATFAADSGTIMESGGVMISDTHDFSAEYGEFLATGNDPTLSQGGSIRFLDGKDPTRNYGVVSS